MKEGQVWVILVATLSEHFEVNSELVTQSLIKLNPIFQDRAFGDQIHDRQ